MEGEKNRGTKQVGFLNESLCDSKERRKKEKEMVRTEFKPFFLAFMLLQENQISFSSLVVCFGGFHSCFSKL